MLKSKKIVDWLYNYSLYFIIGALLLVIIAIEPSFVRVSNFTTILTQSATKIIYACGIAGIIVLGGTDLALGREVGLAAVVAASLLQAVDYSQRVFSADQVPALPLIVPLLLVMVLLGIICAAHGFIVAHWGVAPFVASLGVQLISYGLCLQYFNTVCNSNPLSGFTKTYSKFCQGTIRIGNISLSYLMFYAIAVVAVMWVIWNRTTLGKNMFAIGGNREAAKVCGVNVKRTIIIVYIIAGLLYAFGGVLEAGRTGSAKKPCARRCCAVITNPCKLRKSLSLCPAPARCLSKCVPAVCACRISTFRTVRSARYTCPTPPAMKWQASLWPWGRG